ncbi:hypothetical protein N431DRAFT_349142 [Stipitochalara longipes BDJ]|nr:hypothetical protein N431DRAFT_349142 [Stipitochalara longipes BDJ]
MSTKRSGKNRDPSGGYEWSAWVWDERRLQYYRARVNSKGKHVYEYQAADTAVASPSIPRNETYEGSVPAYTSTSTSTNKNYYQNNEYAYEDSADISNPDGALSERLAQASISDGQTQASSSGNYYNSLARYPEASITLPTIPSSSSRSISADSHDDYASTTPVNSWSGASSGSYPLFSSGSTSQPGYYQAQPLQPAGSSDSIYGPSTSTFSPYNQSIALGPSSGSYTNSQWGAYDTRTASQQQYQSPTADNSQAYNVVGNQKLITGTKGSKEKLDPNYKVHKSHQFKHGAVFKILWIEPRGQTAPSDTTSVTSCEWNIMYDQNAHASIRRFVIVATGGGHSQCLPISTYNMQATTKQGVKAEDHAIIWTRAPTQDQPPREIPREPKLTFLPVEVDPRTPRDKLEKESRLNYAKIYTIEHNVKVVFIGDVARSSLHNFVADHDATWARRSDPTQQAYPPTRFSGSRYGGP